VGYVASIGTFLQAYYIYAVHFLNTGYIIGCRKRELESAEEISYESNATGK
jgi:nitrogen fixation protein NifZ